jgi:acylphosphatase
MDDKGVARLYAIVSGRVQGVSFRYYVVELAGELELNGWVRNRWNGSVEVTAEGPRPKLEQLLYALHQGPPMARVKDVETIWQEATGEFTGFSVRSTV